MLLPNVNRIRLSHVRLHNRVGTPAAGRIRGGGDGQFGRYAALCGRRHYFALGVDRCYLRTLASGTSDIRPNAGDCHGLVGGRRIRLAT